MSKNQLHGKKYEDHIKSAFYGASDSKRSLNGYWDIESKFDVIYHLPTLIKTTSSNIISMADARRFWSISEPYRLLVGKYYQNDEIKEFYSLNEFCISLEEQRLLKGDISLQEIINFHNMLINFKRDEYEEARKCAKQELLLFKNRSLITLNPKIDSHNQRRLQCSILEQKLFNIIKMYNIYNKFYLDVQVDIKIKSDEREFNYVGDTK